MVHICDCFPARIRRALAELPETLDETYERTLRGINKANWDIAHRMFQFVSVASRPLRAKELAELLAFDFEAGSIPEFYEDWRTEDPVDAVLSTCSTLLSIVDDRSSPVIQFSHFSVKEFLTSTRLAKAADIISRYHVSMTPAHTLVAQACLGILLHLDEDVTRDRLKDFPLSEYAADHWIDHSLLEDVSRNVEDGMKQLFDPSKPHLSTCIWISDPAVRTRRRRRLRQRIRNETPLPLAQTSLHYAASWGVHPVVDSLIIEHSQDICSRDSTNNATPLHLASRKGHVKVACKLIEHGADLTAQDDFGKTPLHVALEKREVDVARMLIERGADLTVQDDFGKTPLLVALEEREVDVARMLIERGADLTAQDDEGNTPLHAALEKREVDVARILIERGVDLTAQDYGGRTPLHLASYRGEVDVARMLIERGADLKAQNINGSTPLHLASYQGEVDVARILIERGADLTAQNINGDTPLHVASYQGEVDVARMLIERGADLTAQNNDRKSPLDLASAPSNGIPPKVHAEFVRMFLEHGADVNPRSNDGSTPFALASQYGYTEVVHVISQHNDDSGTHENVN